MLQNLINYTLLADRMLIDAFLEANKPMHQAEYLFSHILNAQHIWTRRIFKEQPIFDRFQVHSIGAFEHIHLQNSDALYQILETKELEEQIIYENATGEKFDNKTSDILFHIVNHSTYHRAQIASQFRLNNINPVVTDYVMFKREGLI